jgi:hypothetical protein
MHPIRHFALASSLLVAAAVAAASAASAQDFNQNPNYGTVTLREGFPNDPAVTSVSAGGNLNAERLDDSCRGFISNAPDVRLAYSTSGRLPLIISVESRADTTLVVNGPDGSWYCDDDGGVNGLNPAVRFDNPRSGRYEIWVGTYSSGSLQPSRLHISEVGSQ